MNIKSNKKVYKKRKIIILIIFFILILYFFYTITSNLNDFYLSYSTRKAKLLINESINNAITKDILSDMEQERIYKINKNTNGEIETIDYNSFLVNKILKNVSNNIEQTLKQKEKSNKNIYFYIPMGAVSNNSLLNDKGPKIPVKIEAIGAVLTGVKATIKEYGINNALIEISITIEVEEKVILPVSTDTIKIKNEIPISYNIITGKVPTYYGGEIVKNSEVYQGLLNKD